jgi:hypothetical protein
MGARHGKATGAGEQLMVKKSTLALSGVVLGAMAGAVTAAEDARINSMSYSTQAVYGFDVVNVYSSDGEKWDTLLGPPLKFGALMDVDTRWPGYVTSMGVLNGFCVDAGCAQNPVIYSEHHINERDLHWGRVLQIDMDDIPITTDSGIATIPLGNEILQACNNHLSSNGASSLHTFYRNVTTSFSVNTRRSIWPWPTESFGGDPSEVPDGASSDDYYDEGDETRQAEFQVQVRCNPYILDAYFVPIPAVNDIEVFLATFSHAITRPDPLRECQQGRVLVRITTEDEGPVAFRLWTDANGLIKDELIETWSAEVGSGVYQAEVERWVSVSETGYLQAMAQVENGGVSGMSSGWKYMPLECVIGSNELTGGQSGLDIPERGGPGGLISP